MLRLLRKTYQGLTFAPSTTPCRTYEAFSSALRVRVSQLEEPFREMERDLLNNGKNEIFSIFSI